MTIYIYDIHIFDVEALCEHLHVIVVMVFDILLIPVVPHKAVAEVSRIGNV